MNISELEEVHFVSNVKCGGENTVRIKVAKGSASNYVAASLDGGIVTVKHKNGGVAYVPLTNVAFLIPKLEKTPVVETPPAAQVEVVDFAPLPTPKATKGSKK